MTCHICAKYNCIEDHFKAEPVKQVPVAESHSGNLRWLVPDEEQPANAKLFLHPWNSRFDATYENGAPMFSKTITKENGNPIMLNKDGTRSIFCDVDDDCESEPVKQEPVAYVYEKEVAGIGMRKDVAFTKHVEVGTDLYAAPVSAKLEWVELTDYEIYDALAEVRFVRDNLLDGCRVVIAKFKDKNK